MRPPQSRVHMNGCHQAVFWQAVSRMWPQMKPPYDTTLHTDRRPFTCSSASRAAMVRGGRCWPHADCCRLQDSSCHRASTEVSRRRHHRRPLASVASQMLLMAPWPPAWSTDTCSVQEAVLPVVLAGCHQASDVAQSTATRYGFPCGLNTDSLGAVLHLLCAVMPV